MPNVVVLTSYYMDILPMGKEATYIFLEECKPPHKLEELLVIVSNKYFRKTSAVYMDAKDIGCYN